MDTQQLGSLPLDANPEPSSDGSTPGSGSGSSETGLESVPKKQKVEEASGSSGDEVIADGDGSGGGDEEDEDEEEVEIEWVMPEHPVVWKQKRLKPRIWTPKDEEGMKEMERFYDRVKDSEGFDVGELPPVNIFGSGVLPIDLNHPFHKENVNNCVEYVTGEFNKENKGVSELLAGNIEKANWAPCAGQIYYITFEAIDLLSPDPNASKKIYQAEVYRNVTGGGLSTTVFREKGQKGFIKVKPDRILTYL
ncbi:unnamed protein product [Linum tenue]|uniref:Cystatin domain-containing protein n=1 Tax=Linum tenue TaxID=586396 RepID=A0AAV0LYK6_9ROSI|nr:unnamed protein product [Linum tenue]